MHKGTVLSLKRLNVVLIFLKNNWRLLLLSFCFILGVSISTFFCRENNKIFSIAKELLQSYLLVRTEGSFLTVFTNSFLFNAAFLVTIFTMGTSVIGVSLVPIITLVRGAVVGFLVSLIYSQYALNGIAFNALILLPPTVISATALIFAARESISFSLQVIQLTFPDKMPKSLCFAFQYYCRRYLLYLFFTLISAALDGWLSISLVTYFNLN